MKKVLLLSFIGGMFGGIIGILILAWTYTYDTTTPAGTDLISAVDDRLRELKLASQERLNVDHFYQLTGSQVSDANVGQHRKVTLVTGQTATATENTAIIYAKDVNSKAELYAMCEADINVPLTLSNGTWLVAKNAAKTGTVNLIKADSNDVAVLPDGSETDTNAAPTDSADIVNKQYVDDEIEYIAPECQDINGTSGAISIRFPHVLPLAPINRTYYTIKSGYIARAGANTTVTYDTPFVSQANSCFVTPYNATTMASTPVVSAYNTTSMTITSSVTCTGYFWIAIGN